MIHIAAWCLFGLVAGLISRVISPGHHRLGLIGTIVLGVVGSLVGGALYQVVFQNNFDFYRIQPTGFIGAVIGGVVLLTIAHIISPERYHD